MKLSLINEMPLSKIARMITEDPDEVVPSDHFDDLSDLYGDEMDVWGDFMVSYLNTNKHVPADFKRDDVFPGSRNFDYIISPDEVAPSDHFDDFEDEYDNDTATEEVYWIIPEYSGEGSGPDGVHFGYSHPVWGEFIGSVWFGDVDDILAGLDRTGTAGVWNHAWWVERA